jgi:hypothetical protein
MECVHATCSSCTCKCFLSDIFAAAKQDYNVTCFTLTRRYKLPQGGTVVTCARELLSLHLHQVPINQTEPLRVFFISSVRIPEYRIELSHFRSKSITLNVIIH